MIGIFDSGFGGLQTLAYFQEHYPDYDYIFLADQAHYPFGTKTPKQIEQYTFQALERLFAQWAAIVIVACNTAAAFAIKKRQSTHPDKKALSITMPGMEKIQEIQSNCKHITVRATEGTMKSGMYSRLFSSMPEESNTSMDVIVATDLVDIVEKGITNHNTRKKILAPYIQKLQQSKADCLVLWCTHFPSLIPDIQQGFSGNIINPWYEAVVKFGPYLDRHPEIAKNIAKNGKMHLYTTGDADDFQAIGKNILPSIQKVKHVEIIPEKYQ
jgi:glutamate racemase